MLNVMVTHIIELQLLYSLTKYNYLNTAKMQNDNKKRNNSAINVRHTCAANRWRP